MALDWQSAFCPVSLLPLPPPQLRAPQPPRGVRKFFFEKNDINYKKIIRAAQRLHGERLFTTIRQYYPALVVLMRRSVCVIVFDAYGNARELGGPRPPPAAAAGHT